MKIRISHLILALSISVLFHGSALANNYQVNIEPNNIKISIIHFGITTIGNSRTNIITVTNVTNNDVELNPTIENSNDPTQKENFTIGSPTKKILPPNETTSFEVKYVPKNFSYNHLSIILNESDKNILGLSGTSIENVDANFYNYKSSAGDTISSIAELFQMKKADLMEANGLSSPNSLRSGKILKIEKNKIGISDFGTKIGETEKDIFPDVPDTDYSGPYLKQLVDAGIIQGYPDGTFKPDKSVNRAEFVKIAINAFKKDDISAPTEDICPDTPKGEWYSDTFYIAKKLGAIQGYPEKDKPQDQWLCKPDQTINKVEALKIVINLTGRNIDSVDKNNQYGDTPSDQWYSAFTAFSKANDLIKTTDNNLNPNEPITRRELVFLVGKLLAQ